MRATTGLLFDLPMMSLANPTVADDVTVVSSFPGNKGPGWKDSIDVAGAVGPQHVIDFDVANFVGHDKSNSKIDRQWCTAWAAFRLTSVDDTTSNLTDSSSN